MAQIQSTFQVYANRLRFVLFCFLISSCGKVAEISSSPFGSSALAILTSSLSGIQVGDVSSGISTTGGTAPLTFSVADGELPKGLRLDSALGVFTGNIPASEANSTYGFSVEVTDAASITARRTYTGKISAGSALLTIHSDTLSQITSAIGYSYKLAVTGGASPYSFRTSSGSLPEGLSLNEVTGVISGTPVPATSNQAYAFAISVDDKSGQSATRTYIGKVASSSSSSLFIVTTSIPTPGAGSTYTAAIAATGGSSPYNFSISSGVLPSGLTLNSSSGLISGTVNFAAQGAAYVFTVTCNDSTGLSASRTYSGFVGTYTLSLVPGALQSATPGTSYNAVVSTVGGQAPYVYSVTAGTLPVGLSLNSSTGAITGIVAASEAGLVRNFTIRSVDANNVQASVAYALTTSAYTVTLVNGSIANAIEGSPYSNSGTPLTATGGTAPYTYSYVGSLPSGVGLTSSGSFFGTPSSGSGAVGAGTSYTIFVSVTDVLGSTSAQVSLTLSVQVTVPVVDALTPTNATLGSIYSYTVTGSGGRPPYGFSLGSGSTPSGLTLAGSGTISGVSTGSSTCPASQFGVRITDNLGQVSTTVNKCIATVTGVSVSSTGFPTVVVGVSYSATVTANGGTLPYTFTSSTLPSGISLNPVTGALTGFTNATIGDYTIFFTATDNGAPALSSTRPYTFSVRNPLAVTAATLPRAGTTIAYNAGSGFSISATGGEAPYTYSIASGTLPNGITMSSSGLISGTPSWNTASNGGTYLIGVRASDSLGQTSPIQNFSLFVTTIPRINIPTAKLPEAVLNVPYAFDIPRIGGVNQFNGSALATRLTWAVTGLPPGLAFSSTTGRIFGTPTTTAGSPYSISITVSDQHGLATSRSVSLKINSAGKTLDFKTARYSDPCPGQVNCDPRGHAISRITGNTQQFLINGRNDTIPRSIQIAKIDSNGRVPFAGANVTSVNIPLPLNIGNIGYLRVSDLDQDGNPDIVFSDFTTKQICSVWGAATVDTYGMPTGFSANNVHCWAIHPGGDVANFTYSFLIRTNLRPDPTNAGRQDIVVGSSSSTPNAGGNSIFVLLNSCPALGNCSSTVQRANLFGGFIAPTGTTTSASAVITAVTSTTGVVIGMPIVGLGIPAGATVAGFTVNTITLSIAATLSNAGVRLSLPNAVSVTGTTSTGSPTWTVVSTAGIVPGQMISNVNFPAGTTVMSIVTNTSVTVSNTSTAAGATAIIVFGPTAFTPQLLTQANSTMRDVYNMATGNFNAVAPNPPTTWATNSNTCPAIAVNGFQRTNTGNGFVYIVRQTFSSGVCQGDFINHATTDEVFASGGSPWMSGMLGQDFNNDGITDLAVGVGSAVNANSASVRVYMMQGNTATFTGVTTISPQLQSRSNQVVGANKLVSYCLNGASSCPYPSILVTCNREFIMGASTNYGCLSILPNQCSTPGCTNAFEPSTPQARIDYPAPTGVTMEMTLAPIVSTSNLTPTGTISSGNPLITGVSSMAGVSVGQAITGVGIPAFSYIVATGASQITINQNAIGSGSVTLTIPSVPTLNDVAFASTDNTNNITSYFTVYPRNGVSTTDPLKGGVMLDIYPSSLLQGAEAGAMKFADINADGSLDLLTYSVNQGTLSTNLSSSSGSPVYSVGSMVQGNYLSNPSANGCPGSASTCLSDPVFNVIGGNHGFPYTWNMQNTMDVVDINNDSVPDVVVTAYLSRGVSVALGATSGAMSTPALYSAGPVADIRPVGVAISDLDQDGFQDIVVTGINVTGAQTGFASWLKGNGDGSFQNAVYINSILNGCTDPRAISAVDLDLDGRPELAILCYATQTIWVSRRHSDAPGTWILQSGTTINTAGGQNGVVMKWGRTNSSGATGLDVVVGGLDSNNSFRIITGVAATVTNATTGAFSLSSTTGSYYTLNSFLSDVDISDLNGDGYGDISIAMQGAVAGNQGGHALYTCTYTSPGACSLSGWGGESYYATGIASTDVTGDGLPEVFMGYRGTSRLIFRTISRFQNLSQ